MRHRLQDGTLRTLSAPGRISGSLELLDARGLIEVEPGRGSGLRPMALGEREDADELFEFEGEGSELFAGFGGFLGGNRSALGEIGDIGDA